MNKFKRYSIKGFSILTFILGGFMIYGFSYNYNNAKLHTAFVNSTNAKKQIKKSKAEKLEAKLLKIKGDK